MISKDKVAIVTGVGIGTSLGGKGGPSAPGTMTAAEIIASGGAATPNADSGQIFAVRQHAFPALRPSLVPPDVSADVFSWDPA
jgi:hypothetical protein